MPHTGTMNRSTTAQPSLRNRIAGVQWRWVLAAGIWVPAAATALWVVFVIGYGASLAIAAHGPPDRERIGRFGAQGEWTVPALALALTVVAASWVARKAGTRPATHGMLVGTVAGAILLVVWARFHSAALLWGAMAAGLSIGSGWLGGRESRSALAGQELLYRASRAIVTAGSPQAIVDAIGDHLADPHASRVALWTVGEPGQAVPAEIVLAACTPVAGDDPWPRGLRLPAGDLPRLLGPRLDLPAVLDVDHLPAAAREAWRRLGRRFALLPLQARDGALIGLVMVASQTPRDLSGGPLRRYQALAAQAALALENLQLVEQGRQIGALEERQRLAREIHDTLAQGFASIVMHLEAAEQALPAKTETALDHLDGARRTAREGLAEARRVVWALRPEILEGTSLAEAIERIARRWSEETGISASTEVTGTRRSLPTHAEATLIRVTQEALANVRKHARAHAVAITLSFMEDEVALDVRDDGVGFDPSLISQATSYTGGGFGLLAMRERVTQLGGVLIVESQPGEGTTLVVTLPMCRADAVLPEALPRQET